MKKSFLCAILFLACTGCYTPLNNSGVATTKPWLDIPAKKTDFDGKQFDSCYQFNLRFTPMEAEAALDLQESCISRCCWRSDKEVVELDFNKNFEKNLKYYGRADKFTPAKITLTITHSGLVNTTAVKVSPRGAITNDGLVKLKRETIENPTRLAEIESQGRMLQARRNAWLADQETARQEARQAQEDAQAKERAQELVQNQAGHHIDRYFYQLNKSYQSKGYVFLLSQRFFTATILDEQVYRVACRAKVQSGSSAANLKNRTIGCGVWKADLALQSVSALDGTARKIKTQY